MSVPQFRRAIGIQHIVAIGVGSAIGVSIFGVLAPAAAVAGPGLLISLALAAVPMSLFAFVYAFMSAAAPASGASFEWPSQFVSPFVGFIVAWLRIVGSTAAIVQHGVVLSQYVDAPHQFHISTNVLMFILFTLFYIVNIVGVSTAAKLQTVMTLVLVGILLIYVAIGGFDVSLSRMQPFAPAGLPGIVFAVPVLVGLFIGVEFAAEVGEEIRDVGRVIAPGLAISVAVVLLVYAATAFVTLGISGGHGVAVSSAPLLDAGRHIFGRNAPLLIGGAAVLSIIASLNGVILIFSRYLFAMGRSGMLPSILGRIHPRFETPYAALTLVYFLSLAGMFLPKSLLFLFLAVNIPTMLKYAASCLSAIGLLRSRPDLHAASQFRPAKRTIVCAASLGVFSALVIAIVGAGADWRPYALLGSWAAVGLCVWLARGRQAAARMAPD